MDTMLEESNSIHNCLVAEIPRYNTIKVEYQNEKGEKI